MGADKRALLVDDVPMLRRAVLAVSALAEDVMVACRPDDLPDPALLDGLDVRLVHDRLADAGPLAGVEAALAAARHSLLIVAAADMPWIEPAVLRLLVETAEARPDAAAVAVETERGPQPLLAVYRVAPARTAAARLLDSGVRAMRSLLDELSLVVVREDVWRAVDPSGRSVLNLNMPADLEPAATRRQAPVQSPDRRGPSKPASE